MTRLCSRHCNLQTTIFVSGGPWHGMAAPYCAQYGVRQEVDPETKRPVCLEQCDLVDEGPGLVPDCWREAKP